MLTITVALMLASCNGSSSEQVTTVPPTSAQPAAGTTTAVIESPVATATTPRATPFAHGATATGSPATSTPISEPTAPLTATTTFDPDTIKLELHPAGSGFVEPLFVTQAGDGSGRLFVVERGGTIRLLDGTLFLDVRDRVGSEGTEQGLLGLAFDPKFATNGLIYVNYTDLDGNTRISRFSLSDDGTADPDSEIMLLTQEQPEANHNGGMLAFGPDGYLYIGLGDGGGAFDDHSDIGNAQDLGTVLGKILRIDVHAAGSEPYGIPPDNPFVNTADARPEIWVYGLRNPWRFSFDRETNDLWIGDVGQNAFEEIDLQPASSAGGENYGWRILEADHCVVDGCDTSGLVPPVASYPHEQGCSVVGGYVYRGSAMPTLRGVYLYADYCSGRVWALACRPDGSWESSLLLQPDAVFSSFGEAADGELYLTDLAAGVVYQLASAGASTP